MKIKQLSYFVSSVRLGSLSAVAKEQGVSVQAVSKAISELEGELGTPLLSRERSGVRPTEFGIAFHRHAQGVVAGFQDLERFAHDWDPGSTKADDGECSLNVGITMVQTRGGERMCAAAEALVRRKTRMASSIRIVTAAEGLRDMRSGKFDGLVTVGCFDEPDIEHALIGTLSMRALLPKGHPLTSLREIPLAAAAEYPICGSDEFKPFMNSVTESFGNYGVKPKFIDVCHAPAEEYEGVVRERGAITLSVDAPLFSALHRELVSRPFAPRNAVLFPIELATLKGSDTPATRALRSMVSKGLARTLLSKGTI